MDTTESMKSDTPQPSAKEPSPQKEQIDNNIAGMWHSNNTFSHSHIQSFWAQYYKQDIYNHASEYVFDWVWITAK